MKILIPLAFALAASTAAAKDGNDPFAVCHQDMERLCKDVKPGEGRLIKCMMDNQAKASPACAALIAKKKEKEKRN